MDHDNDSNHPKVVQSMQENGKIHRLMEETSLDMALTPDPLPQAKEPVASTKGSLRSILEETEME